MLLRETSGIKVKDIAKVEQFSNYYRYVHFDPETNMVSVRLKSRFESLRRIVDLFSFLFPQQLMELSEALLEIQVMKFTTTYDTDVSHDLLRQILAFRAFSESFIREAKSSQDILDTIIKLELNTCFPDLVTSYFLFLTLPVTTASNERSFSKLKLKKRIFDHQWAKGDRPIWGF